MTKIVLMTMAILVSGALIGAPSTSTSKKLIYTQADMDRKVAEVQKTAEAKIAAAEKAANEKVAAMQKDFDSKVAMANTAADERARAADDDVAKRVAVIAKAAEEKIKSVLAESASKEYSSFSSEVGKWFSVENSNGLIRYRDPIWKEYSGNSFSFEVDIPDRRIGAKEDSRIGVNDLSFYVVGYDKDKKPLRRATVVIRDVSPTGGRFSLLVPLSVGDMSFISVYYNGISAGGGEAPRDN